MSGKSWYLARQASAALEEIFEWTSDEYGPDQAAFYIGLLDACFERIAAGTVQIRPCSQLPGSETVASSDLYFARAKKHLVIFRDEGEKIAILAIYHSHMNLPRRLATLIEGESCDA